MLITFDLATIEPEVLAQAEATMFGILEADPSDAIAGEEAAALAARFLRHLFREKIRRAAAGPPPAETTLEIPLEAASDRAVGQFSVFAAVTVAPLLERETPFGAALLDLVAAHADAELQRREIRRKAH